MEEKPQMERKGNGNGAGKKTAVGVIDGKPEGPKMLPVWYFIGWILLIYGILIAVTGIFELSNPPHTVLSSLHPAIWWGGLMFVFGLGYVITYGPRKH
jgi:hypothetical protein